MKMEVIQPFINAADAVLAQGLQSPMSIGNLSMEQEAYRRRGVAAQVSLTGDIEGRIVFDLDHDTAVKVASHFAGGRRDRIRRLGARDSLRIRQSGYRKRRHHP